MNAFNGENITLTKLKRFVWLLYSNLSLGFSFGNESVSWFQYSINPLESSETIVENEMLFLRKTIGYLWSFTDLNGLHKFLLNTFFSFEELGSFSTSSREIKWMNPDKCSLTAKILPRVIVSGITSITPGLKGRYMLFVLS